MFPKGGVFFFSHPKTTDSPYTHKEDDMRGKSFIIGTLVLLLVCVGALNIGAGKADAAEKAIKWKMQTHWPASSPSFAASAQVLVKTLKENTNGRLEIELFPADALVPSKELFNAVKRGMMEIVITSSAYPRDQVPLMDVCSGLPMNFDSPWEAAYFHKEMGFDKMVSDAFAQHGLYYWPDKVYPTELSLKKPVRKFEDFKGLKLRSSGILQVYLTSLGAAAMMLPGSEIYAALTSGVVDGAHWGAVQGSNSMGFYEVSKFHLRPALNVAATDIVLINMKAMGALPADIQQIVRKTLEEHFWERTKEYEILEANAMTKVQKEKGVELIQLGQEDVKKMEAAAMALWDDVAKRHPDNAKAVQMLKDFHASDKSSEVKKLKDSH
ncbi:MAG: twin-arginine translocation pathway signal protein [Desulfobacteraceae bacterium]|nr:MAG: twin-arginine translocation pathway signal protein [Desulfobacteraceae bacterium]